EVHDRHIRLMADGADDGYAAGGDYPREPFVVEAPQVLQGSASARQNHDVHPVGDDREGATQTRRCTRSLDQSGSDDNVGDRIATPKDRHDIVADRSDLRGDHSASSWE